MNEIQTGTRFDTEFEHNCVAQTEPDSDGNFLGLDSDGILCQYHISMITRVTDRENS